MSSSASLFARCRRAALAAATAALAFAAPRVASAAPEARIMRVDPRASQEGGAPILTTVISVVENKRLSDAVADCAALTGNAQFDCMAPRLEAPKALYTPFPFPEQNAIFTVKIDGADQPGKFVSSTSWGTSQAQAGVGTAWLIIIDADRRIGGGFEDAKQIAARFVSSMGANDIVNIMFINDRQVVKDSKWLPAAERAKASSFITSVPDTYPNSGRNRSLLTIIKNAATDGFKSLGNVSERITVPLHQAMVVLSTGFGGTDPSTTGPGGLQVAQYMTGGRFPEDNTALPKAPVPVISIYIPATSTYDEFRQNSFDFMQNLANPEIGGFFTIVRAGGSARAADIVGSVRKRFDSMYLVRWRVACVAPSVTQTFGLVFNNVKPPITGDNSFRDVPVGIDPSTWPLDVNVTYTVDMAKRSPVYPGGKLKVYGDFCWGGDKSRAEVYFLPAGQAAPKDLGGADLEKAKRLQQQLIAQGMKGVTTDANQTSVEFEAPDKEKILHGSGESAVVRVVVYDSGARRTSGVTADSILTLKGTTAPFPILWVLGGLFGLTVVTLLVVVIVRSGGKRRGGGAPAPAVMPYPPSPAYPGPSYGAPPAAPAGYSPLAAGGFAPTPAAPPAAAPHFGLTGGMPQHAGAPPPNPYGAAASRATLVGSAGTYSVVPGVELRAGRDGAQCGIPLAEPRVSAVHASLKLESGTLYVRDENSNNGTLLNGMRLDAGAWTPVPNGSLLRFGPVEFSVRLD